MGIIAGTGLYFSNLAYVTSRNKAAVAAAEAAAAAAAERQTPTEAPSPSNGGYISLANLSPTASAVDVYLYKSGSSSREFVEHDVTYGTVLPYELVGPGSYTVQMLTAGAPASSQPILSASVTVQAGRAYTVAALTVAPQGRRLVVIDDGLTTPTAQSLVRVIQAAIDQKRVTFNPKTVTLCHAELVIDGPNGSLEIANQQPCPRPQA